MIRAVWAHHSDSGGDYEAITGAISRIVWGDDRSLPLGTAMAVMDGDVFLGGVALTGYQPTEGTVEVSVASVSPRWLSRRIVREVFSYVFDELGCQACVARTAAGNLQARRILDALGFVTVIVPRLRGRGADEAVCVLTEEAWQSGRYA